ncbi:MULTISPECIES: peptide ABC transporter substrate-binding protein [Brevibacillus]|jgi:oligopeptide transport system substrate-binding protein|uniref:Family 5 extracellular solute-binding protein n=1 Tax=Brevibacillus borstelensis AK1 TaxID=1300222 RepID=M8DDZ9_9BACL|nr:peptide ABC transporter substrate-binding protein [Brevibacillus borstelensis]EMT51688.1 family 5 extracellular solute-binding protein [Brevibacillus borstelensis AK1]KKX56212.1 ABC transporter substrate-binding protein [Brevibacillus borstelensis cifa_chp40]MCM3470543.1 peptide ABC transporter substrate-binding protein [Brevibacillus borstelensis]MCM3558097.1 peptide ABC transporter substrate-binding protein [Brevibacillus borstelensis]MED2010166.1 peptide ABC transporter substrate-binding
MKKKWSTSLLCLLMLVSLVATGCNFSGDKGSSSAPGGTAPAADGQQAKKESVINLSFENEIKDLNQFSTSDNISFSVLNNVSEGLYRLDEKHEPQPALAKGVEVSPDGLTYTFTLRDGIKWSNGDPITAADFKFAWLGAMNPQTSKGGYAFILSDYIKGGAEYASGKGSADAVAIDAKDDKTLVVTLNQPTPYFLRLTTFILYFPLNEKFVTEKGADYALKPENMLYAGPYKLTSFDPASGATLVKNENYWDNANVKVEKINLKVIKEQSTALNAYKAGELDRVMLSSADVDTFKNDPEYTTDIEFRTNYIQFNTKGEGTSNLNIRKALQLAYDATILEQVILNNGSKAATGMIPVQMSGVDHKSFRDLQGDLIKADAAKAKEYWEQGVKELGKAPQLKLLVPDDSLSKDLGTFLQSEYKKNLGIDVTVETKTVKARNQQMDEGNYQFGVTGWGADYDDAMTYLDLWANHTPYRGNYENPKYDELIASAKKEVDETKRINMLLEAEKILLAEDAVVSPLFYRGNSFLQKPHVKNLIFHPYGSPVEYKYATVE